MISRKNLFPWMALIVVCIFAAPHVLFGQCTATISSSGTTICTNSLGIYSTFSGGTNIKWYKNGVQIAGQTGPSITVTSGGGGTYYLTCTISGCSGTRQSNSIVITDNSPVASISPSGNTAICGTGSVTLSATTGTGQTYQWRKDGSNISGATASTYSATTAGSYTCNVTKSSCTKLSNAIPITVVTKNTTLNSSGSICNGGSVTLTATAGYNTYVWYKNGAYLSAGGTNTMVVTTPGIYYVNIQQSGCSFNTMSAVVQCVTLSPAGPIALCNGQTTTLTLSGGPGTDHSYYLYRNGSQVGVSSSPSFVVSQAGSYTGYVLVPALDDGYYSVNSVTVTSGTTPSASISGINFFCTGSSTTLSANTGSGYTYEWYRNIVLIAGQSASTVTVNQTGNYTVKVTSNGCSTTSSPYAVGETSLPTASISGPTYFCTGSITVLTASSGTGYTYQWYRDGVLLNGEVNGSLSADQSGNYTVTVTANGCSRTSTSFGIEERQLPAATVSGASFFCAGGSTVLSAPSGQGYTYQWIRNDSTLSGATQSSFQANIAGSYKVQVTANGCSRVSTSLFVNRFSIPIVIIGDHEFCQEDFALLQADAGPGTFTYEWLLNGGATGVTTKNFQASQGGAYTVKVTSINGCQQTSASHIVDEKSLPAAHIVTPSTTIVCNGLSVPLQATTGTGYLYQWKRNNENIAGATNSSYNATTAGLYQIEVTKSGCLSISDTLSISNRQLAEVAIEGKKYFCNDHNTALSFTPQPGYSYQWLKDGQPIAGATGASYVATESMLLQIVSSDGECSDTVAMSVITELPVPSPVNASLGDTVVWTGQRVMYGVVDSTFADSYRWEVPGEASITYSDAKQSKIQVSFSTPGAHVIKVFTYKGGCQGLAFEQTITVEGSVLAADKIPEAVKTGRDHKPAVQEATTAQMISTIDEGDIRPVFEGCLDGKYYVGFQLHYDFGDHNTTQDWSSFLQVSLLHEDDTLWTKSLQVDITSQTIKQVAFHDTLISCTDDYRYVVSRKILNGPVPEENVYMQLLLFKANDAVFTPASQLTVHCPTVIGQHENIVSWNYAGEGAQEFDIEWVYIERNEGYTGSTPEDAFLFKEPVGVTIDNGMAYSHLVYYPDGKIWYRIRAIGYNPQYPEHRILGHWFYQQCELDSIQNHEPLITWQEETVYADQGKNKKAMNYFDGSLRQRQSLTNLSTDQTTLVGESMYDFEGRKAVDVMSVPITNRSLKFKDNFNMFASTDSVVENRVSPNQKKFFYDNYRIKNGVISSENGAGKYFSSSNDIYGIHRDLIPAGEGYVYSQMEYLNDGTKRVSRQSGFGKAFHIDSTHTSRYYYGEAAPAELIRLFGSNVGNASHYKKNLTVDPNGQVNVVYVDQEGRIVATALAGDPPSNVDTLQSFKELLPLHPIAVDISSKNKVGSNERLLVHKFLNESPNTSYLFKYNLSALASEVSVFGCSDCVFDLKITITDPDGSPLRMDTISGNQSSNLFTYERVNITATSCTDSISSQVVLNLLLDEIGDYTLTKTLTVREQTFEQMRTVILAQESVQASITQIRNSYSVDPTDCEICTEGPDAEAAVEKAIEEIAYLDCENILNQIILYYQDRNHSDTLYVVPQDSIELHPLYCKYLLCSKNQDSDKFEKRLSRIGSWSEAVAKGYNNLLNIDPFFNNPALSGSGKKGDMQAKLNDVFVAEVPYDNTGDGQEDGQHVFRGNIEQVTLASNTAMFINENGEHDVNGHHILYLDLMNKRQAIGEVAYREQVDRQHWSLYKGFYFEAKRRQKLEIGEYYNCEPARRELEINDELPVTPDSIAVWGEASGVGDSIHVSSAPVQSMLINIKKTCDITLSAQDSAAIVGHLKDYFNGNRKNFLRLIFRADLGQNAHLTAIQNILSGYNCSLDSIAEVDPLTCGKDTVITVPKKTIKSLPSSILQAGRSITNNDLSQKNVAQPKTKEGFLADRKTRLDSLEILQSKLLGFYHALDTAQKPPEANLKKAFAKKTLTMSLLSSGLPDSIEYAALMKIYGQTNDKSVTTGPWYVRTDWLNQTGWQTASPAVVEDVSAWYGVKTDGDGHVIALKLGGNRLKGQLPAELGNLKWLRKLEIYQNSLTGSVPNEVGRLRQLDTLIVHRNFISSLGDSLWMHNENLRYFDASYNYQLTDDLPEHVGRLFALEYMDIGHSQLTGSMPESIGRLTQLKYLNLGENRMSGMLPDSLGFLTKLEWLDLGTNRFEGPLPSTFENLDSLKYLALNDNQIEGHIEKICSLTELEHLNLENNKIDSLSNSIGNLTSLKYLNLGRNVIDDTIPVAINSMNLNELLLHSNFFKGQLPTNPPYYHDFSNNMFSGKIPVAFGLLSDLWLSYNQLTGFEDGYVVEGYPSALYIDHNKLEGPLPDNLVVTWNMTSGDVSYNKFTFSDLKQMLCYSSDGGSINYSPQDSVGLRTQIGVAPSITLTATIDRSFDPPCTYQWFKYVDGINDVALNAEGTAGHTVTINSGTGNLGKYYYQIKQPLRQCDQSLDELTLTSRFFEIVQDSTLQSFEVCLSYDTANATVKKFGYKVNWNDLVQKCLANAAKEDSILVDLAIEKLMDDYATEYYNNYRTECLTKAQETLKYEFTSKQYHYTLYYYDQSKNLVRTVPPEGVNPLTDVQVTLFLAGKKIEPAHNLVTEYQYSGSNVVLKISTPDAGVSNFYYNQKSQLRLSQNAQQYKENKYSYNKFDDQGRVIEYGVMVTTLPFAQLKDSIASMRFPTHADATQLAEVIRTRYDFANPAVQDHMQQDFLRSRVSSLEMLDENSTDTTATYFSYDIHGNVRSILQRSPGLSYKRTDYKYDLTSGKIDYVLYQQGKSDQFAHRYTYDSDNRLTEVSTSTDRFIWNLDAMYFYYQHGPLARVELGALRSQGLDFYYTLQGWIRGVNQTYKDDPTTGTLYDHLVGKDVFAYSLGYYEGDYKSINPDFVVPDERDHMTDRMNETLHHKGLYNGNISWMVTDLKKIGEQQQDARKGMQGMLYMYDQLHRLTKSRALFNYSEENGFASRTVVPDKIYDESYSYDGNGNILTLKRNDGSGILRNDYLYYYYKNSNKLRGVVPIVRDTTYAGTINSNNKLYRDILVKGTARPQGGQAAELRATRNITIEDGFEGEEGVDFAAYIPEEGPFIYNASGNLVADQEEGSKITWTSDGKVRQVKTRNDSVRVVFKYDVYGNRIEKRMEGLDTTIVTKYSRDMNGNIMAIYQGASVLEYPVYSNSRVGLYRGTAVEGIHRLNQRYYELTNHLGNVLAVVTDKVTFNSADTSLATVVSTSDYYPFGLQMENRTWRDSSATKFRYGFNGKEMDDAQEWGHTSYDYGFRIYNPELGRFLSTDPLTRSYPALTPYQFASNQPIRSGDLDGLEAMFMNSMDNLISKGRLIISRSHDQIINKAGKIYTTNYSMKVTFMDPNCNEISTDIALNGITQDQAQGAWYDRAIAGVKHPSGLIYYKAGQFMRRLTQDHTFDPAHSEWSIINHVANRMLNSGDQASGELKYGYENTFIHFAGQAIASAVYGEGSAKFVADIHERRGGNYEHIIKGATADVKKNDVEDMIRDLVNNEYGRQFGSILKERYDMSSSTVWTNELSANVLNDIQGYFQEAFPAFTFDRYEPTSEFIQDFTTFMNNRIMNAPEEPEN